ncbi:hypothetical protein GYMLUDRAFT_956869 [Collybiopsis luxurians FD-317 M1]|nr:hypothetical protein GYMLUDRAFT_956869 [Collybiopsis luxurians FD-317 M1]
MSNAMSGMSGNASPALKEVFDNPAMVFPTLDRDGKYRVLGFAMETVFQRVAVTEIDINLERSESGLSSKSSGFQSVERTKINQNSTKREADQNLEGQRTSVKLVCETDVLPDMANHKHILHGGCIGFLIDMCVSQVFHLLLPAKCTPFVLFSFRCSSLACVAVNMLPSVDNCTPHTSIFPPKFELLSQSMHVVYHSPSPVVIMFSGDRLKIVSTTMPISVPPTGKGLASNVCICTEIWSMNHHRLVASGTHNMMPISSSPRGYSSERRETRL